jgi:hypothetical protein
MTGYPNPDLSHFVFDLVHHVIQFQVYVNLCYPVVKIPKLRDLSVNVFNQLGVSIKMHGLDVNVHNVFFSGETICKELATAPSCRGFMNITKNDEMPKKLNDSHYHIPEDDHMPLGCACLWISLSFSMVLCV